MHKSSRVSDIDNGDVQLSQIGPYVRGSVVEGAVRPNNRVTLQTCTRNGDMELLRRMLRDPEVVKTVNDLDDNGMSALHYAARANIFEAVALLLKQGNADPKVRDEEAATPLHYACRKRKSKDCNDRAEVVNLLVKYCDVNIRDKYASTPLHFAAMRDNVVAANALLSQQDILVNAKDHLGCTPLHEAATYNHPAVAELLVRNGARVTMADLEKCTPLHLAAIEGFPDVVKLLVKTCEPELLHELIDARDKDDCTALHYAVEARSLPVVKLLFRHGAKVNALCRRKTIGSSALHMAAIAGEPELTKYLLDHGAQLDNRDYLQATPLHKAAQFDCVADAKQMLSRISVDIEPQDIDNYTPLMTAVAYGSLDIVRSLLDEGANCTVQDAEEKSIIYIAVENDQTEVLEVLLNHIKDSGNSQLINYCDRYGDCPLHKAAERGVLRIVQLLIDHGGDLAMKNESEETPFLLACSNGHIEIVKYMLDVSETVLNDENESSDTALHQASEAGHLLVVQTLVEWGVAKEARNNRSRTPLDLAADGGHLEVVRYLLDEDVSPNPLDKEMVSPLQMASKNGHDAVVTVLVERGADVSMRDVEGNNCLDLAIEYGQKSVVMALLNSKAWHIALSNENRLSRSKARDTPLRKLFRQMPDMARIALDCCVQSGPDNVTPNDPIRCVDLNYDYLDDTYTDYDTLKKQPYAKTLPDEENVPKEGVLPYTLDLNWIKENHPLSILIEEEREDILGHPLVLSLIRHKWALARSFYFLYMVFYALYLSLLTAFMIMAEAPFETNMTVCDEADGWEISNFENVSRYIIWVLACIGLALELFQMFLQRWLYIRLSNLLDWFSFVSAIILMVTYTNCGIRTAWQWQMGSFTVLATWFVFILYLRRLPGLGIYVVMIVEIFITFSKFFVAFFLFIIAFAITFFLLLQNQEVFSTPFYSIVKSFVMMIGEFDYTDIFFPEEAEELPPYRATSFAVFILFMIIASIIIMNLLIGLAVDDVTALREHARVVKLSMQIELALDIELALPYSWARNSKSNKRRQRFYPNEERTSLESVGASMMSLVEGPLLSEKAIRRSLQQQKFHGRLPELMQFEDRVTNRLKKSRCEFREMSTRIENIETMLTNIIKDYKASKAESGDSGGSDPSGKVDSDPPIARPSPPRPKAPLARQPSTIDIVPLPAQYMSPPATLPPIQPTRTVTGQAQGLDRDMDDQNETSA